MIQRFRITWQLLCHSADVLSRTPKLFIFPFITLACTVVIVLFFFGGFLLQPTGHAYSDKAHWNKVMSSVFTQDSLNQLEQASKLPKEQREKVQLQLNNTGLVLAALVYFLSMFLATFFNVAFYHEIMNALKGEPVGLRQGFSFALSRLPSILLWSMLAGLVGYLISQLEQRLSFIGKIIVRLIGLAWSVAAIFAIPVIVCQDVKNPVSVLKASAASLKKTWGETLIGLAGLNLGSVLVIFASAAVFIGAAVTAFAFNHVLIGTIAMVSWIVFIISFSYFVSVASNVYHCALYLFASTGQVPDGYTREMMDLAWKHKKA